ncbi:hypothetical protein V22_26380 [Calycomorphotria hydatis]|uniref:Uncharacterized protein n=2 Tax=Calycomorphotria hydatis TaxID=2528027 RepID=A0A517TAI4_9PLAN|nr:hypothetical protein V22_26380 [Calycomorphotria hydatis]
MRQSLWAGAILLVVFVVSGGLWLLLSQLGDITGAAGAKGIAVTTGVLLTVDVLTLVVATAIAVLNDHDSK